MDSEGEDNSKDFGNVIDALHNKSKLSALRTYQGDMAEFIKNKNESVVSIAVKEKERKEEKNEKAEKLGSLPKSNRNGFQINFTIILSSILLIGGGILAYLYIFDFIKKEPVSEVVIREEIIPYNNSVTLANVTNESLGPELGKLSPANGINVVKISDINGLSFPKAKDFFNFLKIPLPAALERTLKDQYAIGIISQNNANSLFLIISVDDFGRAFSAMLDWEENMVKDLSFLSPEINTATSTEVFAWKDVIIKNKDTRGLVNEKGKSKIAYTFLDKNTILIVNNLSAIGDISSAYASRSVAR